MQYALKKIQDQRKNNFTLVKNISVIQSLSHQSVGVLEMGRFKIISRSDKKIGKNIFEIREKYFRISKLVDRSTVYTRFRFPDGGFAKKWGKFSIVAFWWKIFCFKD